VKSSATNTGPVFGIAGVQMHVSAFDSNVDRMGNYLRHIRARFPWVRMVLFSELSALGPKLAKAESLPGSTEAPCARWPARPACG
jgi:predicted amidohydrolase